MIYMQVTNYKCDPNLSDKAMMILFNSTALAFLAYPKYQPLLKNRCDVGDTLVL